MIQKRMPWRSSRRERDMMRRTDEDEHMKLIMTPDEEEALRAQRAPARAEAWRKRIAAKAPAKPARGSAYGPERRVRPKMC